MARERYLINAGEDTIHSNEIKLVTAKDKRENWWYYHKRQIIPAILVVALLAVFIHSMATKVDPDYTIGLLTSFTMPETGVQQLEECIAAYADDRNGDGKVVVTLNVYTLDYSDTETQTESAAYLTMAGTTKLAADVQGGLSSVFLLWDPAGFEESTGSLRYLDGTLPAADSDEDWWNMVYKWDDCPVLASLDLGDYGPDTTQSRSGSSQEYMSQFYVGMRGAWNSGTADNLAGGEEFWQKLTEGAVSTAAPED